MLLPLEKAISQTTFEFTIKDSLKDQILNDGIELPTGGYIFVGQEIYYSDSTPGYLYRISPTGNLLGTGLFTNQNKESGFLKIANISSNQYLLGGFVISNDSTYLWLTLIDSLFNVKQEHRILLDSCNLFDISQLKVNNGKIYCLGICETMNHFHYAFILQLSLTLQEEKLRIFTEHPSLSPIDLLVKQNGSGYYCFLTAFCSLATECDVELDTNYVIQDIYGVPSDVAEYAQAKWIGNNSFILVGQKNYANDERGIGVLSLDTLIQLKNESYIGKYDTLEWPGLRSRLDFIDTNKIYVAGTHNFCRSSPFCPVHSWFSLNQMDTSLNINWQHFYGGDANYTLYGIRATSDGGCLLFGSRYNLNASTPERDIYAFKVNADGLIFSTGIISPKFHEAILYPTPGSDQLVIESNPQISGAEFVMTSMNGVNVISTIINSGKMTIKTHTLNTGTYIWRIINKNKVVESGKWVKD